MSSINSNGYLSQQQLFQAVIAKPPEFDDTVDVEQLPAGSSEQLFKTLENENSLDPYACRFSIGGVRLNSSHDEILLQGQPLQTYFIRASSQPDAVVVAMLKKTGVVLSRLLLKKYEEKNYVYQPNEIELALQLHTWGLLDGNFTRFKSGLFSIPEIMTLVTHNTPEEPIKINPLNFKAISEENFLNQIKTDALVPSAVKEQVCADLRKEIEKYLDPECTNVEEAEKKLAGTPGGTFLIRRSGTTPDTFALSVVGSHEQVRHLSFKLDGVQHIVTDDGVSYQSFTQGAVPFRFTWSKQSEGRVEQLKREVETERKKSSIGSHPSCFLDTNFRTGVISFHLKE